ncbi:MAG: hypothetical protein KH828_11095 [Clostridiales bacterium]|nr:hypothetical protein [Clostridiales bacterium]
MIPKTGDGFFENHLNNYYFTGYILKTGDEITALDGLVLLAKPIQIYMKGEFFT